MAWCCTTAIPAFRRRRIRNPKSFLAIGGVQGQPVPLDTLFPKPKPKPKEGLGGLGFGGMAQWLRTLAA